MASLGFPLTPIERRFWLIHQLYHRAPVANIGRVIDLEGPLDPGSYPQLFLSSLLHRCSARASSRRPWNPNWYSGPRLNLRLLRRRAKQTSTVQLKTSCGSRTTYRAVLSFAVVFFGFMNITIVSFLPRTIWFSTAGDCRAQFLARFVLISGGSGFRWTLECGKTGADSCLPPQTQTQDTGKTGSKA